MNRPLLFSLQFSLTLIVCLFLIVPVVMSVAAGFTDNYFIGLKSGLTLRWIAQVWALYAPTIWLSLLIALACLACTVALGVPAAWGLYKSPARLAAWIEECLMLPVAIPGLATALGLLLVYGGVQGLRGSWLFILIGHVLFTLPFMVRPVLAVMKAIDIRSMEEAAASLGAGKFKRFANVVLPNCASGVLAGAFMVVSLSIGEFNITWMLHTPLTKTLPVGLADSYASMRLEIGSAYTTLFLVMIIPWLLAMQMIGRPRRKKKETAQ